MTNNENNTAPKVVHITDLLNDLRKKFNMSSKEVAYILGVSPATTYAWFHKIEKPSTSNIFNIMGFVNKYDKINNTLAIIIIKDADLKRINTGKLNIYIDAYAKNYNLKVISSNLLSLSRFKQTEDFAETFKLINNARLQNNNIQDLMFYSDICLFPAAIYEKLFSMGIKTLHVIGKDRQKIDQLQ